MLNQNGGAKTDTVVKLSLVFFISLLSFSVGTFVGKQVSDSDKRRMALENEYSKEKPARTVAATNSESSEKKALSEDEIEQLSQEFVEQAEQDTKMAQEDGYKKMDHSQTRKVASVDETPVKHDETHKKAEAKEKVVEQKHDNVAKAAHRVANNKAPEADKPAPRKPQSVLPSYTNEAKGKYTVQVASYSNEDEAKKFAQGLREKGYADAFYIPAQVKGSTWYRVSIGLFESHKSANVYKAQLIKAKTVSSALVQKIIK
ncbi:MAG: SPOR domain-containing protein [Bdellovibrionales bacterium]|nr:SPOR domain-containing protein [Bdellovibrionales bacterium]